MPVPSLGVEEARRRLPELLERAAAGEVLAVIDGGDEPEVARFEGPQAGGAVVDPGTGGAAARVDNLLPAEQDSVRRFFGR